VFTTNFDDLINESCYLYSERVRPIVCAHDSEVSNVRITKRRVKIIKLHGDFLFDNIKNTIGETKRLEKNMESKLAEFGREFGLIVIGYGGRDNSVMSILENLLKKPEYFRHGIYWCLLKEETPRKRIQELLTRDRVQAIEIAGFDEFMALLHRKVGLQLPASLVNPLKVAERRSKVFCSVESTLLENEIIRQDSEKVLDGLGKVPVKLVKGKYMPPEELPASVKAAIMKRIGDLPAALEYMRLVLAERKNDPGYAFDFADILARLGDRKDELKEFALDSAIDESNKTYFLLFTGDDNMLIDFATGVLDKEPSDLCARINRAIAYKRIGDITRMNSDLKILEELQPDESVGAGIAALRKDREEMFRLLDITLSKKMLSIDNIQVYPVFEDYRNDAEFQKFLEDRKEKRDK